MTLKEKLKSEFPINTEKKSNKFANKCVRVADEHAIEFAEWLLYNCYCENNQWWLKAIEGDVLITSKELLEIFKKENEL
jgi:hypothetical protein